MVQGDFEFKKPAEGEEEPEAINEIYFIFFSVIGVLFSNVILLSLINAVLGDVYSEVISVIDEKCLKAQNLTNLENEAFVAEVDGSSCHFAWVEYVDETCEVWKGQVDVVI